MAPPVRLAADVRLRGSAKLAQEAHGPLKRLSMMLELFDVANVTGNGAWPIPNARARGNATTVSSGRRFDCPNLPAFDPAAPPCRGGRGLWRDAIPVHHAPVAHAPPADTLQPRAPRRWVGSGLPVLPCVSGKGRLRGDSANVYLHDLSLPAFHQCPAPRSRTSESWPRGSQSIGHACIGFPITSILIIRSMSQTVWVAPHATGRSRPCR